MSQEICARTDVDPNTRVRDLTTRRSRACATTSTPTCASRVTCAGTSPRTSSADGDQLLSGRAAPQGLPVHGQRTHTNARTRKGPKKTVAGKKKVRK